MTLSLSLFLSLFSFLSVLPPISIDYKAEKVFLDYPKKVDTKMLLDNWIALSQSNSPVNLTSKFLFALFFIISYIFKPRRESAKTKLSRFCKIYRLLMNIFTLLVQRTCTTLIYSNIDSHLGNQLSKPRYTKLHKQSYYIIVAIVLHNYQFKK